MKKTLLGVIASPRRLGNCEIFTKEVFRRLEGEWDLRLMRLCDLDIKPCKACYSCLFDSMRCPLEDDFLFALDELCRADAYIVAAPAYLLSANSVLKRFLDRGLQYYAFADRLWGKPAAALAVAGIDGMEGSTKLNVESFVKLTFGDLRASDVVYGALPGETVLRPENLEVASRLAKALCGADAERAASVPTCALCGGDTFRFLPDGKVRCMLCSATGEYDHPAHRLEIRIFQGEHPLFHTREDVARHAEWLRGMKHRFMERRRELKEVAKRYLSTGTRVASPCGEKP